MLCGGSISRKPGVCEKGRYIMADDNICKHELCDCLILDNEAYCCDRCEETASQDIVEIACDCGHAICSSSISQSATASSSAL